MPTDQIAAVAAQQDGAEFTRLPLGAFVEHPTPPAPLVVNRTWADIARLDEIGEFLSTSSARAGEDPEPIPDELMVRLALDVLATLVRPLLAVMRRDDQPAE